MNSITWKSFRNALSLLGALLGLSAGAAAVSYFQSEGNVQVKVGPALTSTRMEWFSTSTISEIRPCLIEEIKTKSNRELNEAQIAGTTAPILITGITLGSDPLKIVITSLVPRAEGPTIDLSNVKGLSFSEWNSPENQLVNERCESGHGECPANIFGAGKPEAIARSSLRFKEYLGVFGIRAPELPHAVYNNYLLSHDPLAPCAEQLSLPAKIDFFKGIKTNRKYWNRILISNDSPRPISPVTIFVRPKYSDIEPIRAAIDSEGGELLFSANRSLAIRFPTIVGGRNKTLVVASYRRQLSSEDVEVEYQPTRAPAVSRKLWKLS